MSYERLLPIGSVVLLHGGEKRLMITGRIQTRVGDTRVFDYSGCLYPEGVSVPNATYFFDHDAIEHLFFVGFQDEEELAFRFEHLAQLGDLQVDEEGNVVERPRN